VGIRLDASSNRSAILDNGLWCLIDSADPTTIPGLPIDDCSILFVTSPRGDYLSRFRKLVPIPPVFYMPLMSRTELEAISSLYPNASAWEDLFYVLGGVPRFVLRYFKTSQEFIIVGLHAVLSNGMLYMWFQLTPKIHRKLKSFKCLFTYTRQILIPRPKFAMRLQLLPGSLRITFGGVAINKYRLYLYLLIEILWQQYFVDISLNHAQKMLLS
jgi:hypothetical protein